MGSLEYKFTNDTLFKALFVKHQDLLKRLVADLLSIPFASIGEFVITNPEMPPEVLGDKFCRLDINMTVDGRRINLEVQVRNEGDYPERVLYHWAREYSTALKEGEGYRELPQTIVVSIVDFTLFECVEFQSEYRALEIQRYDELTDKMRLKFFELPKLPEDTSAKNGLLLWLSLFKAGTEEELAKMEAMEVPEMGQAIGQAIAAYRSITASEEFREMERMRSKARHDEAQALWNAEQRGEVRGKAEERQEIIELLQSGKSLGEIRKEYGLR